MNGLQLTVQPMVHVADMGASVALYEAVGGTLVYGSRDGDWALLRFGGTMLSLLAHPPSDDNPEPVELQFTSAGPLEAVEAAVRAADPTRVYQGVADEMFGRSLKLRTPDGLVVKVLELERELIA